MAVVTFRWGCRRIREIISPGMNYGFTCFSEIFISCYGFEHSLPKKTENITWNNKLSRDDADARIFRFLLPFLVWRLLALLYWGDLEAIYSNSNILFLHEDAEILFGFRIYILWSENLPCINYGFVIFCISWRKLFSSSEAFGKFHSFGCCFLVMFMGF